MASILDRYGIKEVADVTFYKIDEDGKPKYPVLFLDTLKVSTIEQTASQVDARGGKGNPKLVTWDYGKEITVNLTDALFSPKSMAILFGDGQVTSSANDYIMRTAVLRVDASGYLEKNFVADVYDQDAGSLRKKIYIGEHDTPPAGMIKLGDANLQLYDATNFPGAKIVSETGTVLNSALTSSDLLAYGSGQSSFTSAYYGQKVFMTYGLKVKSNKIVVSGDTFPGTYYITGDTYVRSDIDGADHFYQFIIPKAKVSSQNTITLEAEGDPSTFNMNLTVLRPEDGEMMRLIQYDLTANG